MFEYESPLELFLSEINTQFENDVMKAVQHYGISVDKYELIRALQYDRDQYSKGYQDAKKEIIHCKDCKHFWTHRCMDSMPTQWCDLNQNFYDPERDYCSLAERREDETN